jgi:hypothetical protein
MNEIMEKFGNTKVRDLIKQFPGIVGVLEEYQIDCVHCKMATCRLYDIAESENITMADEIEFMEKLSTAIFQQN